MVRRIVPFFLLLLLLPSYYFLNNEVWNQRAEVRRSSEAGYIIPSKFSRVLALDYRGLLSDYLLLKTITFFGGRAELEQTLSTTDWNYLVGSLDSITDLDPYFLDPYLLAESLLTWESGRYEEANRLLEKGRKYRVDDWQLPFFIGFNYFFFLKNYEKGSEYLMIASRLPHSPAFLPSLAARIGYYGDKADIAAMFLKGIIAQTGDQRLKKWLNLRLVALERAAVLEDLVEKYQKDRGELPKQVQDLITSGYIKELPEDPYGGKWVLMKSGRVFSTSRFVPNVEKHSVK